MQERHTCVSRKGLAVIRKTLRFARSRHSEPIRPYHLEETPEPHRVSSIPEYQNIITATTPAIVTMDHREEYLSGYSSPTTIPRQASSSPTEPHHHRALLIADPVHHGKFTFHPFFSTTKAIPRFALIH
jgi:hypothetical protein